MDDIAREVAEGLAAIHDQPDAHLPGDGRGTKRVLAQENGVDVNVATLERIASLQS